MKIIITEEQKKKLFIPRKLSDDDSRYSEWNNSQPIKDGKRINQYDSEGRKQGYWEEYWDNGALDRKGNYINGEKEGYWEIYYIDGELYSKGNYKNSLYNGEWFYYDYHGRLEYKTLYKNGKRVTNLRIDESKKLFIPRKLSGEGSRWEQWNNMQPIVDGVRINQYNNDGKEDGLWEYYHLNGNLNLKGNYINGKEDGIWYEYFIDGKIAMTILYKNGKFIKELEDNINESEQPKKKLFIPRKLSGEDNRYSNWNNKQPRK
jgi:antitoxin component YwqK of YwqJK toxin-antitoxin module